MPCQTAGMSGVLKYAPRVFSPLALALVLPEASFLLWYEALDEKPGPRFQEELLLSSPQPWTALPGLTQLAF